MRVFVYHKPSPQTLAGPVKQAIMEKRGTIPLMEGPVILRMRFIFLRTPTEKLAVPLDKWSVAGLQRAVMDVLPGLLYHTEKQVAAVHATKEYGNVNGIELRV
jgi:hypothetical protein